MSLYGIFRNKDNKTLVYYPVPKNANSSAKYFLAKHCGVDKNFKKVIDLNDPNSKIVNDDVQSEKTKPAISSFLPSKQKFSVIDAWRAFKLEVIASPSSNNAKICATFLCSNEFLCELA